MSQCSLPERAFRAGVVPFMVGCVVLLIASLGSAVGAAWTPLVVGPGGLVAAAGGHLSRGPAQRSLSNAGRRVLALLRVRDALLAASIGVLCVAVAVPASATGRGLAARQVAALGVSALVGMAWLAGRDCSRLLALLDRPEPHLHPYLQPARRLRAHFLAGIAVAFSSAGLTALTEQRVAMIPWLAGVVFAYALCGIALLAHVQFSRLQEGWQRRGVWVAGVTQRDWLVTGALAIGLLAVGALVMSSPYAAALARPAQPALHWSKEALGYVITQLMNLVTAPPVTSHVRRGHPPKGPVGRAPRRVGSPGSAPVDWVALLRAALVLLVALGLTALLFRRRLMSYLRHPRRFRTLSRLLAWIVRQLRVWRRRVARAAGAMVDRAPEPLKSYAVEPGRFRLVRISNLSPREQVVFYYTRFVRYAAHVGLPQRPWQTPRELAVLFEHGLPSSQEDVAPLTESYLEARYSLHDIQRAQATSARDSWHRLRATMRSIPPD